MKFLLVSAFVAVALAQAMGLSENELLQWESFKVQYMKEYETPAEEAKRMRNFADNLKFIREHNAKFKKGETTFTVGVNKFADLSDEEFRAHKKRYSSRPEKREMPFNLTNESDDDVKVDWRKKGAVTPVKDRGNCDATWAFSATGSVEGQHFLKTKQLVSLSEQNLLDCTLSYGTEGCYQGETYQAFRYIKDHGVDSEVSYPYSGKESNTCHYKKKNVGATISGFDGIDRNEIALQSAVKNVGPISVAMDGGGRAFLLYKSGIYESSECNPEDLNTSVLVVGYGTQGKNKYWLIKNSWGTNWGLAGYFMLAKNKHNMCGVANLANYPYICYRQCI